MNRNSDYSRFVTSYPRAEIVTTDKGLIDWLISINTHNRKVKKNVVRDYADEMRGGKWDFISQGIGISKDGILLDGQHRALANREAGYPPIKILVVSGLDASAQTKVDTHAKRTVANILSVALEISTDDTMAAALRILCAIDHGYSNTKAFTNKAKVEDLVDTFWAYESYIRQFNTVKHKGTTGPFWACLFFAAKNGADIERCKRFVAQFKTGEELERDSPILRLRALNTSGHNGCDGQLTWFCLVARALAAFLQGEKLHKLYTPSFEMAMKMLKDSIQPTL